MRAWPLLLARRTLAEGGIVACPTEGVWGLSCDPLNADAVYRLLSLKRRRDDKGLVLVAADAGQLQAVLAVDAQRLLRPDDAVVTWVARAHPALPAWITGGRDTVAVRLTRHPLLAALCRAWGGPLVSTSANPSGLAPARSALGVRKYFPAVDDVLHGPLGGLRRPSRIIELESGKVLRA